MRTQLLVIVCLSVALVSCAPLGGRGGPEGGAGCGAAGDMPADRSGGGAAVVAGLQGQLQRTAEALQLSPTQAVLWDAYQERIGALMADQLKLQPYRAVRQHALQQIAQKVDVVRNRLAAMEEIQEAAGKLYAKLDERQQAIADSLLPLTVPALYSGLVSSDSRSSERGGNGRGGRAAPGGSGGADGGGGMGGPGGGWGGGFGR